MPGITPRQGLVGLHFNGVDLSAKLNPLLLSATYTEVAGGASDEIELELYNFDLVWLMMLMPELGSTVGGGFALKHWDGIYDIQLLPIGIHTLSEISYTGNPLRARFKALSVPAGSSFQVRPRTQTWENAMLSGIASELCARYGLGLEFNATDVNIEKVEQSQQADSTFLMDLVTKKGLRMKIYREKLVIYDPANLEAQEPRFTIGDEQWIDRGWTYNKCIEGVYTGAHISYKREDDENEIDVYVGYTNEDDPKARVMFLNETCSSEAEARERACAEVNSSNERIETISGEIWPTNDVRAGMCVQIEDLGRSSGKYFIDRMTIECTSSGTKQSIEAHRVQPRI